METVSRSRKVAGTSAGRIVPPNQTIRIRRPKKREGGSIGLDFEVHERAHNKAAIGKRCGRDLPRRQAVAEMDRSAEAKAVFRCCDVLNRVDIPADRFCFLGR